MRGQQNSPHLLVLGWDTSAICFPSMASQPIEQIDGATETQGSGAGPAAKGTGIGMDGQIQMILHQGMGE